MGPETAKAVIANRTLRFSRPVLLNDPFDMDFDLQLDIDAEALKPRVLDAMWEAHYGADPRPPANALGFLIELLRPVFPVMDRQKFAEEFGEAVVEGLERMPKLEAFHAELRSFSDD